MNAPILNVIFHGTFVFCKKKADQVANQWMHVYIPAVATHLFTAGNWLGETELEGAEYRLDGVLPPRSDAKSVILPMKENLVVNKPHKTEVGDKVYAKLLMTPPDVIVTQRSGAVP